MNQPLLDKALSLKAALRKGVDLFEDARAELAHFVRLYEGTSDLTHALLELFHEVRARVTTELGLTDESDLATIEQALVVELRSFLTSDRFPELVTEATAHVNALRTELTPPPPAEPAPEEPPAVPEAPPETPSPAPEEETPPAAVAPDVPPTAPVAAHPAFVQEVQAAAAVVIPEGNASSEPATGKTATGE